MIILDTLVIGGLKFVLRRIAEAVDAQLNDVDALREELLAAQMRLELGELSAEEFAALERDLLARLREIRARAEGEAAGPGRITGVDVSIAGDVEPEPPDGPRAR
ncbi:MAG TPA: gas vesicle protein GvpG [Methylomirabilota bacterium]|nr:gas vesicle protein GvpG [Methylomirabilota bacterium]